MRQGTFQYHDCENRMWRLTGQRWTYACYGTPNFIDDLDRQDRLGAMSPPSKQQLGFLLLTASGRKISLHLVRTQLRKMSWTQSDAVWHEKSRDTTTSNAWEFVFLTAAVQQLLSVYHDRDERTEKRTDSDDDNSEKMVEHVKLLRAQTQTTGYAELFRIATTEIVQPICVSALSRIAYGCYRDSNLNYEEMKFTFDCWR